MRNKYNPNDSLFSIQYKIPYDKSSIQQHLQESQEEINFIKVKLTEAYEKLQHQIKFNTDLEEQNEFLAKKNKEVQEKYHYQKKQNIKLKQTLQVILKNRKVMQEETEELKTNLHKKVNQKDKIIQQLQKEVKNLNSKYLNVVNQLQDKARLINQYSQRLREQSMFKQQDNSREIALANKIKILEQEIHRITQEKYIQVNRLRHQLNLYQRNPTSSKQIRIEQRRQQKREERKRDFSRIQSSYNKIPIKFDTGTSQCSETELNKENVHSLQLNIPNNSLAESSIAKWKRPQSVKESHQQVNTSIPMMTVSDDQQLTQFQIARKKAEQQLCALQKIKRPSNEQRDKITRLQRQIYHLDSDIAGLKRKIRRKY